MENNEIQPTSIVTLFDGLSLAQRQYFAKSVIDDVNEGRRDPLQLKVAVKAAIEILQNIDAGIDEMALSEHNKHGQKEVSLFGATLKEGEFGTKYLWEKSGDPVIKAMQDKKERLDKEIKGRQEYLKTIKSPTPYIDPNTSEEIMIMPVPKTSTTKISVTLSK